MWNGVNCINITLRSWKIIFCIHSYWRKSNTQLIPFVINFPRTILNYTKFSNFARQLDARLSCGNISNFFKISSNRWKIHWNGFEMRPKDRQQVTSNSLVVTILLELVHQFAVRLCCKHILSTSFKIFTCAHIEIRYQHLIGSVFQFLVMPIRHLDRGIIICSIHCIIKLFWKYITYIYIIKW